MRIRKMIAGAMLGVAAIGLSGCATGLPTQVSRFQAMPAPQGQSFYVVPADPSENAGLEFSRYAALVSQAMQAQGYAMAPSAQAATMLVKLDYGVDEGQQVIERDPFAYSRYGAYGSPFGGYYGGRYGGRYDPFWNVYYGRPYYSRYGGYGAMSPFYYGWDDPFYGSARSYTLYKSFLDMDIVRKADNQSLFEGHAKARSQNDNLGVLVPNLVTAMFTGFPGRSGETVKITVPPAQRTARN